MDRGGLSADGDGTEFFGKTQITHGMQDLISEGVARLAGASAQAVFHLKQAMGGGKTHLLVGFGLLAKHPELRKTYCGGTLYGSAFGSARTAAFNGRNNPDHFFWGDIAGQLGKGEQFRSFWTSGPKAPDEKDWLKLFDGGEPILILFDEMPPYFHYLDTQKVGNGTVADIATRAFANLLTAAGKKSNVCVVVSDLAATYDTGTRLINRALEDVGTEGAASPFFSPDGQWIAFLAAGKLKKVGVAGGAAITICDTGGAVSAQGGAWGPNNIILFQQLTGAFFEMSFGSCRSRLRLNA
jgi:WD40-like Beta Propeller Repeat